MPLIPSRVLQVYYYYIPPNEISAGDIFNILCNDVVQLSATFNKPIAGHTIEWVQTSGTIVTLNDSDTLTPWFINPNTDDLSFRVYIDRYGPDEVFDDVLVFRNPTGIGSMGNHYSTILFGRTTSNAVQNGFRVEPRVVPRYYNNNTGSGAELITARVTTQYMLEWTIPADIVSPDAGDSFYYYAKYSYIGAYAERYNVGTSSWISSAFIPKEYDYYIMPFNDGTPYRLTAVWEKTVYTSQGRLSSEIFTVTPDSESFGIYRSLATSPMFRAHGNSGAPMGNHIASTNFLFTKTVQNPFRISQLAEVEIAMGEHFMSTDPWQNTVFRAEGKKVDYSDEPGNGMGDHELSSRNFSLTVFRASGISIGSV